MAMTPKAARINTGLTQAESAKALGISENTLSNYETGKTIPKLDVAMKMAELYKCSLDDLIFLPNDCA